jgi:hypothetical protein
MIGPTGKFGTSINLSGFPDGTITVVATLNTGGKITTVTGTMGKNSVAPPAAVVSAPTWASLANISAYNVTVTGQPGAIANVVISDGQLLPDQTNGMDFVGANGTVVIPVDVSSLVDGPITIAVTLTNGAGDSTATLLTETKDTVPPVLSVAGAPTYINAANVASYHPTMSGEKWSTVSFVMTDGVHTQTATTVINGSAWWNLPVTAAAFNDGLITLTVTETDGEGNPNVVTLNLVKDTVAPAGSLTIAASAINGQLATSNPTLALSLAYSDVTTGVSTMAISTNGGSTYGPTIPYAATASVALPATDGLYTVAVNVTDAAGNSTVFTQAVRLDRTGPVTTYTITAPNNNGSYDVGRAIVLTYTTTDVDNVASVQAVLDGTVLVANGGSLLPRWLAAGAHSIVITATDGMGNVSFTTISFQVHLTIAGFQMAASDTTQVTSSTTMSQLQSYLSSAQTALNANNHTLAKSYLASLVSYVQTQSGLTITAPYATLMVGWANDLISRL